MTDLQVQPTVADCSPSAKLVHLVLEECGPMTQQELRSRTALSTSAIRGALNQLGDDDLVERSPGADGRSDIWQLANN